jgi:hypothetical protein
VSPPLHEDLLMTLGEVAVAFVGFSMVVGVLGSGSVRRRYAMRDVAEIGLQAVAGSFLPLAINAYGASPASTWRLASAGFLAYAALGLGFALRRAPIRILDLLRTEPIRNGVIMLLNFGLIGLLLFNAFLGGAGSGARYVTAVMLLLAIAGHQFLDATFRGHDDLPAD